MKRILCSLGIAAVALVAGRADAAAVYVAEASSSLSITGFFDAQGTEISKPLDLLVEANAEVFDEFDAAMGNAEASAAASASVRGGLDLGVGDGVVQSASASGSAEFPPSSSSDAVALTDGLLFLENQSTRNTYRIDLELSVEWLIEASAAVANEAALAEVGVLFDSLEEGVLFDLTEVADTAVGDRQDSDSDVFTTSVILGPGEFDELFVETDALGTASAVPEPTTALLLVSGLAALALRGARPH